jgi:serine/threonine protein phosphatase 1
MNTYVLGDIHGAHRALKQVLERSNFDKEVDRLIFLGDVCDGWSEVYKCVEELLTIRNIVFVRGNHDDWFIQYINTGEHPSNWSAGGINTLRSYANNAERDVEVRIKMYDVFTDLTKSDISERHIDFFNNSVPYYILDNKIFVHGGFNRHYKIAEQPMSDIFWWDRDLFLQAMSTDSISNKQYNTLRFKDKWIDKVFIGHTPTINWDNSNGMPIDVPILTSKVINVDTGAGFSGKLTLMNIDTLQYYQSDTVKLLYPNELGRN